MFARFGTGSLTSYNRVWRGGLFGLGKGSCLKESKKIPNIQCLDLHDCFIYEYCFLHITIYQITSKHVKLYGLTCFIDANKNTQPAVG